MSELIECANAISFEHGLVYSTNTYSFRVVFPGKKEPTFKGDLLTGTIIISNSSELEGKKGTLFVRTKDAFTYQSCANWFNSFANKKVGDLVKRYENIVTKIDSHHKGYEILYRPAETILDETTEWVYYYLSDKKFNKQVPIAKWNMSYILCCGGDEKLIQGAATSFVVLAMEEM